jgi:hypothetical protein
LFKDAQSVSEHQQFYFIPIFGKKWLIVVPLVNLGSLFKVFENFVVFYVILIHLLADFQCIFVSFF